MPVDVGYFPVINDARVLGPQMSLNYLAMHILDLGMASGTGRGNIVGVDTRSLVGMRPDVVCRVARCANGCNGEAL